MMMMKHEKQKKNTTPLRFNPRGHRAKRRVMRRIYTESIFETISEGVNNCLKQHQFGGSDPSLTYVMPRCKCV